MELSLFTQAQEARQVRFSQDSETIIPNLICSGGRYIFIIASIVYSSNISETYTYVSGRPSSNNEIMY